MNFAAFIFDMDGTLLDNMGFHREVWVEFLAERGVHLDSEQFSHFSAGRTNAEILRKLISPELSDQEVDELSEAKEELYRQRFRHLMKPAEGLPQFLRAAKHLGVPMAVASSAGCSNIHFHLDVLNLEGVFDTLVGSEDVTYGKPDPEIFLAAAQRLGVPAERCLVFEDTPAGIEAAQRAGMQVIAFTTSYPMERLRQNPVVMQVHPDFTSLDPAAWFQRH
jgi:beta-phosphoglucomutase family hydrolase